MPVTKPRTKLVNFRLSEDEFVGLRELCLRRGARSLSDFTRSAVLKESVEPPVESILIQVKLADLSEKVGALESGLRQLLHHISPRPGFNPSVD